LSEFTVFGDDGGSDLGSDLGDGDGDTTSLRGVSSARSSRSHGSRTTGGKALGKRNELRRRSIASHSHPVNALPKGVKIRASDSFVETLRRASMEKEEIQKFALRHNSTDSMTDKSAHKSPNSEFAITDGKRRLTTFDNTDNDPVREQLMVNKVDRLVFNGSLESSSRRSSLAAGDTVPDFFHFGASPSPPTSPTITVSRSTGSTASKLLQATHKSAVDGGGVERRAEGSV